MGLFGKKDFTKINDQNKKSIVSQIEGIKLNVRGDSQVLQLLAKISNELRAQTASKDKEVAEIDVNIIKYLKEANDAIVKGSSVIAVNKLDAISGLVNKRRSYCQAGGHLTKEQQEAQDAIDKANKKLMNKLDKKAEVSRVEELQNQIDAKSVELEELQKEFARLKERNAKNPGNPSIIAQGKTITLSIKSAEKSIIDLTRELEIEKVRVAAAEGAKEQEELRKNRTVSDEQHAINLETIKESYDLAKEEQTNLNAETEIMFGAVAGLDDPFAESGSIASSNPFEEGAGSTAFEGKSFDKNMLGTQEMRAEIAKTKSALEKSIEKYDDKIDDANDQLQDLDSQLKPLLLKRKNASPSECLVIDGQIDQLYAKRNGVQYSIKRYRQGAAVLQEQLLLMDKLATQQDLEATQSQIDKLTEGKFKDFEGLSMYLKESVSKSNEKLEEIGMAGMVADSEEINMNTFSSASAELFDAPENKDENKYDVLMKDLGLMA